jgi:two-component system response regulator AtoC
MEARARILVVDDEEVVRRSYARILGEMDCDAQAASDGEQALQAMAQRPFDVVLLDLRMPGAQGLDILKTIKERWPASEVVIITGYPTFESARTALRLGACDYLAKPPEADALVEAARGALRRKKWELKAEAVPVH